MLEQVSEDKLVVGDVVIIEAGMRVPADGVIIKSRGLKVDESAMTGECELVRK